MSPAKLHCIRQITQLHALVDEWKSAGDTIALVPTMGALHQGHVSLLGHARTLASRVVASIFVNPLQFGPTEDFTRYPRDVESDIKVLEAASVDAAWLPDAEFMFPNDHATRIVIEEFDTILCGLHRPGHFSGVATVVTKLFNQTRADLAVFGEKDFQQLRVIQKAVRDLDLNIQIHAVPTDREADGLARSSRNRYLTEAERRTAPKLYDTLVGVAEAIWRGSSVSSALHQGRVDLQTAGFSPVQYLELRDARTLHEIDNLDDTGRLLVAAYLGRTRLIDNIEVSAIPS